MTIFFNSFSCIRDLDFNIKPKASFQTFHESKSLGTPKLLFFLLESQNGTQQLIFVFEKIFWINEK